MFALFTQRETGMFSKRSNTIISIIQQKQDSRQRKELDSTINLVAMERRHGLFVRMSRNYTSVTLSNVLLLSTLMMCSIVLLVSSTSTERFISNNINNSNDNSDSSSNINSKNTKDQHLHQRSVLEGTNATTESLTSLADSVLGNSIAEEMAPDIATVVKAKAGIGNKDKKSPITITTTGTSKQAQTVASKEDKPIDDGDVNETALVEAMKVKLMPKSFQYEDKEQKVLARHQFLHLHHMKTGGTSMDRLISCAKDRLQDMDYTVNSYNIHECNEMTYKSCVDGTNEYCTQYVDEAAVLSYCAPLKDLAQPFNWTEQAVDHPNKIQAVTVFRHPVARVWSMYRFQTKMCYGCRPLKEIYELIDAVNNTAIKPMCVAQLTNHLTRNVLAREELDGDDDVKIQNAIHNMKTFFTLVGLTEDMENTAKMTGMVFPWLAVKVEGSDVVCEMPHANSSPQNNRCNPNGSHMPLPDTPDEETAAIILKHNLLDMKLYEAVIEQFRIQKLALGL